MNQPPLLQMRGIVKRFPGVVALDGVQLDVHRGEVHALVGENGAGKSTLMHILAGVYQPDAGEIEFNGQSKITIENERAAQQLGVAIVFQERSLFADLSVAENIFAGRQPALAWGHIRHHQLYADARALLDRVALPIDPRTRVGDLSPAQQQMVEIAKALSLDAQLLILDEPTAALTDFETRALFNCVARCRQQGVGVIYISHRLEEVFQIADRVTVLKDGRWQGTFEVAETSPDDLVLRMVGRELAREHLNRTSAEPGAIRLEVRNLSDRTRSTGRVLLQNVTFTARAGQITALAGLAGAGRTETALAIFGHRATSGDIIVGCAPINPRSPREAIAAGIGYLPEDRKDAGLFLEMSIAANIAAARLDHFGTWWQSDRRRQRVALDYRQSLKIATPDVRRPVVQLSGGNQQKVLLARWLLVNPKVLIADEPTRGVDVGAKAEVHALLRELARQGAAVIVISSDLLEVLAIADRVVVMREGTVAGELSREEATEESIMRLATRGAAA
jgi:ABC-type sugar transport system ATPase subunit